jgi:hypothetical protein
MRTVTKRSVGLNDDVLAAVEVAAGEDGVSVSSWLNEAAEQKLALRAMADAVSSFEREHGEITDLELARARRRFGSLRRSG